jgi:predicted DCC family thiol-disulfide oxidoreductase YuxK
VNLRPVLLYDGGCRLCRWAARVVASLDRRQQLALLPLGDREASGLLASVPEDERAECWWLVLRDGTTLRGDRGAGAALLRELRMTRHLGASFDRLRLSLAGDALDRLASTHRRRLGRLVPDGAAPRRYP